MADLNLESIFGQLEQKQVNKPLIPEKHLQSPIIVTLIDRLRDIVDKYKKDTGSARIFKLTGTELARSIRRYYGSDPSLAYSNLMSKLNAYCDAYIEQRRHPNLLTPDQYPNLFVLEDQHAISLEEHIKESDHVTSLELDNYVSWISDVLKPDEIKKIRQKFQSSTKLHEKTLTWWKRAEYWDKVVEANRTRVKNDAKTRKYVTHSHSFLFTPGYVLIKRKEPGSQYFILVFEQLQMIQDVCRGRFNVHLAIDMKLHNGTSKIRGLVEWQLSWQDHCLRKYGNDGYDLCKSPEALMKTLLTSLSDGDILKPSSFKRTVEKIRDKERGFDSATPLVNLYEKFIQYYVTDIGDACELYGLCKLAGHPTVYAMKSGKKIRELAKGGKRIAWLSIVQNQRMFRHMVTEGYIKQYHQWPKFIESPNPGTKLYRHWLNRSTALPVSSIDLEDYDFIRFGELHKFNHNEAYDQFLDDKACCPGASETPFFWFSPTQMNREPKEERRLLLKTIQSEVDTYQIVERLRRGGFTQEEMVVELTQKEREFKNSARCFAKMTMEVRLYWLILETNLKSFGKLVLPELTMTMSEAEEKNRLYELVRNRKNKSMARVELDLGHWNISWYEDNCKWIAEDFEDIFDMPGAWSQVFYFFSHATIIVMDKNTLPPGADPSLPIWEWPESDILIRGWKGGQEGIQQYWWSWLTVVMCRWALLDIKASYAMAGQGDNQVFTMTFSVDQDEVPQELAKTLNLLESRFASLNHELKPEECIDSRTVLTYSKEIYVDGAHRMYTLKFASRAFGRADKEIPSLSKDVASIMATSMAVADTLKNPIEACRWKNAQLRIYLALRADTAVHKKEWPMVKRILRSRSRYAFYSLVPGSLGGLPVMPWTRFFMKGEVDDLSWDVASVIRNNESHKVLGSDLEHLFRRDYSPINPRPEDLIDDPHSIPLMRPSDRLRLLKNATENQIKSKVTNSHLKPIIESDMLADELKKALSSTKPFYPDIMQDIYKLSPAGLRDRFLARFNMTRTLSKFAPDIAQQIETSNIQLMNFIENRYKKATKEMLTLRTSSPFAACQKLRDLWKCGINNANVGVYTPFEYQIGVKKADEPWISAQVGEITKTVFEEPGTYPPNFGTKTRAKVSSHGYKIYDNSSTIKDLKSLVLAASELGSDEKFFNLMDQISLNRSPWTIQQLSTLLPTAIGGCAAHRHQRSNQAHFATLGSKTVPTHLNYSSDDAGLLSGGFQDYPVVFQSFYLTLASVVAGLSSMNCLQSTMVIGLMLIDEYKPIDDEQITLDKDVELKSTTNYEGNPLVYVSKLEAYAIPDTPSPDTIRFELYPERDPLSLLYTKFTYDLPEKLINLEDKNSLINQPIDLMDFKEFLIVPFDTTVNSLALFIIGQSLYQTQGLTEWGKHIKELSVKCGALLARMCTHPLSKKLQGNDSRKFSLGAGRHGGINVSRQLADELFYRCSQIMTFKLHYSKLRLYLLNEPIEKTKPAMIRYLLLLHTSQHTMANNSIYLSQNQINNLLDFMTDPQLESTNILIKASRHFFESQSKIKHKSKLQEISPPLYSFCNMTTSEFIRHLRNLDKPKVKTIAIKQPNIQTSKNQHLIFSRSESTNTLTPRDTQKETDEQKLMSEMYLQSSRRAIGIHSGITTDWLVAIKLTGFMKGLTKVTTIGVGSGGSSAACLMHNCSLVQGVDLRTMFPLVTSREATFKPPEVVARGLEDRFHWHPNVWQEGGDYQSFEIFPEGDIIIDMDLDTSHIVQIMRRIPCNSGRYMWRQRCDENHLKMILSSTPKIFAYNFSIIPTLKENIFVFYGKRSECLTHEFDYASVEITSSPIVSYKVNGWNDRKAYVPNLLKISPDWFGDLSSATVKRVLLRLRDYNELANEGIDKTDRDKNIKSLQIAERLRSKAPLTSFDFLKIPKNAIRCLGRIIPYNGDISYQSIKRNLVLP
jgi:hypothetical protein